jgi:hypothetical protein
MKVGCGQPGKPQILGYSAVGWTLAAWGWRTKLSRLNPLAWLERIAYMLDNSVHG